MRKTVDVLNGLPNGSKRGPAKSGAKHGVDNHVGARNLGPDGFPRSFVGDRRYSAAQLEPALKVCRRVTPELIGSRKKVDVHSGRGRLQVPRDHKSVSSVVPLPAKHANGARLQASGVRDLPKRLGDASPRGFHQL